MSAGYTALAARLSIDMTNTFPLDADGNPCATTSTAPDSKRCLIVGSGIVSRRDDQRIRVCGYRSIRELCLDLQPINVLTGPNGSGKSNLYNSLVLIGRAAQGQLAHAIAEEGGTPSVFWAGGERVRYQRKRPPKRVVLGFEGEEFAYELQVGLPGFNEHAFGTMFKLDPRVKGRVHLAIRNEAQGLDVKAGRAFRVLSQIIDPHLYPEISALRNEILSWRFYHHFRMVTKLRREYDYLPFQNLETRDRPRISSSTATNRVYKQPC